MWMARYATRVCSSLATELVKGRTITEALNIRNSDIAGHLKLPPVKLHCSMLAEDAIKAAVKDVVRKNPELEMKIQVSTLDAKQRVAA